MVCTQLTAATDYCLPVLQGCGNKNEGVKMNKT